MFKKFESTEVELLYDFFRDSNISEKHRTDSFDKILEYLETDCDYICYINKENNMILSSVFMRDLPEQKCRILDFISSRKNISVYKNKVGDLVDYGIKDGESRGFYRFYTMLTEEMKETVDVLMKKNLVFPWRKRYDTYVDEILEPNNFSYYNLHWTYLSNTTVRDHRKVIRHHFLKPEFRSLYE